MARESLSQSLSYDLSPKITIFCGWLFNLEVIGDIRASDLILIHIFRIEIAFRVLLYSKNSGCILLRA